MFAVGETRALTGRIQALTGHISLVFPAAIQLNKVITIRKQRNAIGLARQIRYQYCGFVTFWCGSVGSVPLINGSRSSSSSGSCYFDIDLQDANKIYFFFSMFFCLLLLKVHLLCKSFFKDKGIKKLQNSRNQVFYLLFLLANRRIQNPDPYL